MKNVYTLTITLFAAIQLIAQPVIKNQRQYAGSNSEFNPHITLLKNGGFIMAMESRSNASGNKSENNRDSTGATPDYWVVKVSALGLIEWDKTFGGDNYDIPASIIATSDGGYIVAGQSLSGISGDKTVPAKGQDGDIWIVKMDSLGNKLWDKAYGGDNDESAGIIMETAGGFFLSGSSSSGISGDKTETSRGLTDYWLLKLDKDGNKIWDKTYGGDKGDNLVSMDITAAGGCILGGTSNSGIYKEKTQQSRGGQDYWVITVDKNGNKLWDKTLGGPDGSENLGDLQATKDGGYIIGGLSQSNIGFDKSENCKGGYDYWIIKLDASGNKLWDKTFGGSAHDQLYALEQTKDKGYVLAGYSYSGVSGDKTEPLRNTPAWADYWVVKTDSLGNKEWDKSIGGLRGDHASDIKQLTQNDYIVAGHSQSPVSGDKTIPNLNAFFDAWLVRLQVQPQGIITTATVGEIKTDAVQSIAVYPNPARDVLHIKADGKSSFSLSDQKGKIILTKTITNSGYIDISKVKPGVYFLSNNKNSTKEKIIISR